jgi:hypothetical protein
MANYSEGRDAYEGGYNSFNESTLHGEMSPLLSGGDASM